MAAPPPASDDFDGVIVQKPWGYEYLVYHNDLVGLWYLHIRSGARTSLHCHPRKKTGLILLSGEAEVSYLNDATRLHAPAKLMIRPGLFHSTAALSPEGIHLLEIETPREKDNLVRLEDSYGREAKPYEGSDAQVPLTADCLRFGTPAPGGAYVYERFGCRLAVEHLIESAQLMDRPADEILMILDGGLFSASGEPILTGGDAVAPATVQRLARAFAAPRGILLLSIRKG